MEERITKLEEMIAHQGIEIEHLSTELHAQQKEIQRLHTQLKKMDERIQEASQDDPRYNIPEPPPPHY